MNTTSLTDRYVDAAMRTVPEQQRQDLGAELRASIEDQIDGRVHNGEEHSAAERAVLTELGDPDKLAAGYTDRPLWLIGPRYYLTWWRLTKLLWAIVPACAAFGVALGQTLAGEPFGAIVGTRGLRHDQRHRPHRVLDHARLLHRGALGARAPTPVSSAPGRPTTSPR